MTQNSVVQDEHRHWLVNLYGHGYFVIKVHCYNNTFVSFSDYTEQLNKSTRNGITPLTSVPDDLSGVKLYCNPC